MLAQNDTDKLQDDIDLRLADPVVIEAMEVMEDEHLRELLLRMMRWAYYVGYRDSWTEPRIAALFRDHGEQPPPRREQ